MDKLHGYEIKKREKRHRNEVKRNKHREDQLSNSTGIKANDPAVVEISAFYCLRQKKVFFKISFFGPVFDPI
jgi:hypothetical protein